MLESYLVEESSLKTLSFHKDEPLAPHSTFGIGGQCDYFVTPFTENALIQLISFLKRNAIRFFVIGNGSNLLFDDDGFRGCIISTKELRSLRFDKSELEVGCGYSLIALSSLAQKRSLSGLEFACSIPATIGGAIYMNAGAYGGEMKNIVTTVRYLDKDGTLCETDEHNFSYRHSIYQEEERVILSCRLSLTVGNSDAILATMNENKRKREATQPIKEKSAGSVFRRTDSCIPARLIDEMGLKGLAIGGAEVSRKHAGFIINRGNATANDVLLLIDQIRTIIKEECNQDLSCEIKYIPSV